MKVFQESGEIRKIEPAFLQKTNWRLWNCRSSGSKKIVAF
jgi:hypothetical protein